MCVIVAKNKSQELPSKETLYKCFLANPHGCGFMYNDKNRVLIEKGFMDFDSFYNRVMELDEQINLRKHAIVFHFRISTSGLVDSGNCHPYPITDDYNLMRETFLQCSDVAFCHNGIIRNYLPCDRKYNDTQTFGVEVLSYLKSCDKYFYKDSKAMKMLKILADSKLCFLDSKGNIYYVGTFFTYDGYQFSNLNFVNRYTTKPKKQKRYEYKLFEDVEEDEENSEFDSCESDYFDDMYYERKYGLF